MIDSHAAPDWQDGRYYQPLNGFDAAGLAWEFVRRNPDYRTMVMRLGTVTGETRAGVEILPARFPGAAAWGLSFR